MWVPPCMHLFSTHSASNNTTGQIRGWWNRVYHTCVDSLCILPTCRTFLLDQKKMLGRLAKWITCPSSINRHSLQKCPSHRHCQHSCSGKGLPNTLAARTSCLQIICTVRKWLQSRWSIFIRSWLRAVEATSAIKLTTFLLLLCIKSPRSWDKMRLDFLKMFQLSSKKLLQF